MSFSDYIIETHKWAVKSSTAIDKSKLVLISLCVAHKIKNIVKDVTNFIPTNSKLIIEILVSMASINSYESLKSVWSLLVIILLSEKFTMQVKESVLAIKKIIFPSIDDVIKNRWYLLTQTAQTMIYSMNIDYKYLIEKKI